MPPVDNIDITRGYQEGGGKHEREDRERSNSHEVYLE
jgi:hypothetical protein